MQFIKLSLFYLVVYYLVGWLCYVVVFSGTFALLDKWRPHYLRRNRNTLEFWVAALSGFAAVSLPLAWLWVYYGHIEIALGLIIGCVSIFMAYSRLREKALEPDHAHGDYLGFSMGMAVWGALYALYGR